LAEAIRSKLPRDRSTFSPENVVPSAPSLDRRKVVERKAVGIYHEARDTQHETCHETQGTYHETLLSDSWYSAGD